MLIVVYSSVYLYSHSLYVCADCRHLWMIRGYINHQMVLCVSAVRGFMRLCSHFQNTRHWNVKVKLGKFTGRCACCWWHFWVHLHGDNYTVLKKVSHLMVVNNFGKCAPIIKILSPVHHKGFHLTCSMLLHYRVKFKIQKCYLFWQHLQQIVDMFVKTVWALDLTLNSS